MEDFKKLAIIAQEILVCLLMISFIAVFVSYSDSKIKAQNIENNWRKDNFDMSLQYQRAELNEYQRMTAPSSDFVCRMSN